MKKFLVLSLLFTLCCYSQDIHVQFSCIMQDSSNPSNKEVWFIMLGFNGTKGDTKVAAELSTIPLEKESDKKYLGKYTTFMEYQEDSKKCPGNFKFDKATGLMKLKLVYSGCEAYYLITMHGKKMEMPFGSMEMWDIYDIQAKYVDNIQKEEKTWILDSSDKSLDVSFNNDVLINKANEKINPKLKKM